MLSVPQIFLCRFEASTKVSILFSFLRIGHVVERGFFLELKKPVKGFLADFAGVRGRDYGTAWLASMATALKAEENRDQISIVSNISGNCDLTPTTQTDVRRDLFSRSIA
jgi:nucleoside 2-deoxyribosyltransferase